MYYPIIPHGVFWDRFTKSGKVGLLTDFVQFSCAIINFWGAETGR